MIGFIYNKLKFAVKFKTLNKVTVGNDQILVLTKAGIFEAPQRCPHQGAELKKSRIRGNYLICHWHGCKYDLIKQKWCFERS